RRRTHTEEATMTVPSPLATTGTLAVDGRNVFGILKESLYGESDIVFRELVSNACDAIAKRTATGQEFAGRVEVAVEPETHRIVISDNGIGMSGDEVHHYINQIALSGTAEFVRAEQQPGAVTIGHFGVGFYSAFMLADTVELQTRSAIGADPVGWLGKADMTWRIDPGERVEPGTSVILHLAPDSPYLTDPDQVVAAVRKYFPFPPLAIAVRTPAGEVAAGDPAPAWRLPAGQAGDAELKAFYREHFDESSDPLGWVRLESPDLGLRGMIFLRDTQDGAEAIDGRVDVISRGVWLGSDLPGLIPKFVNLQHAVIECDQLDLVVSRSQVRGAEAGTPALVAECLSQELAIAMHELFTEQRSRYEEIWPELAPFVKYGVLTDRIFASVMTRKVLFAGLDGRLQMMAEYLAQVPEKFAGTVFYTTDLVGQAPYVQAFRSAGIPALVLDHVIDQPLLQRLELVSKDIGFVRLDADVLSVLATDPDPADAQLAQAVTAVFAEVVERRLPQAPVRAVSIAAPGLAVTLTVPEVERRIDELRLVSGLAAGRIDQAAAPPRTLLVNLASPLVRALATAPSGQAAVAAEQLIDLVLLGQDELTPEQLLAFSARTEHLLAGYLGAAATDTE
ncbi:MAG: ATP-binding protein, partial [Propionibacteriaceae bacterium]|nr:ATP-binding protein [Propionibacteriaceae bacterium]